MLDVKRTVDAGGRKFGQKYGLVEQSHYHLVIGFIYKQITSLAISSIKKLAFIIITRYIAS